MASSFCRLGTNWPRILSPWDKLGGVARDWRRFGVTGSGSWRLVVCRSGIKRLLILSPWDKTASHFVLLGQNGLLILSPWDKLASHVVALGQTGWRCSGLEAVRRHRIRLLEARSLSLWDKMASSFCRLGTIWPLILSPWDKLGGIVRDWRRFGVTGSGSWRLVVCRSGTKRLLILSPWDNLASHFVALGQNGLLILSPWDKLASHFVALGQTGWRCSGLEAVRRHRIRLLEARSLSLWDKTAPHFVALGQNGLSFCPLGTD